MGRFAYEAMSENGKSVSGVLEAESAEMANQILLKRGYIPFQVRADRKKRQTGISFDPGERLTRIKTRDLILFTKQFKTMFKAGVSILDIFQILEDQTESPKLKKIANAMAGDVQEGLSLWETFKRYPQAFSPLYCSVIRAGEASDSLPRVLERLIYIMEHENKIRTEIKGAFKYPLMVLLALGFAFFILLNFVIPKFVSIFQRAGVELPLPTRISIELHHLFYQHWHLMGFACLVGGVFLLYLFTTERGRYWRDLFFINLPILGDILIKAAMARFSSIFSILQASGVGILESLKILSGTINNAVIAREFDRIHSQIQGGSNISRPLKTARYFTPMVINMVAVGERSEKLDEMLAEVAKHYDSEVEYAMQGLSEAIAPILTVGLAVVVGFFAFAIFLPMWDLAKVAG